MKTRMKILAKTVVIAVTMMILLPGRLTADMMPWSKSGNTWYILNYSESTKDGTHTFTELSVYLPSGNHTLNGYFNRTAGIYSVVFKLYYDRNEVISYDSPRTTTSSSDNHPYSYIVTGNSATHIFQYRVEPGSSLDNTKNKVVSGQIVLPEHCHVKTNSLTFATIEAGGTSSDNIDIPSFLTPDIAGTPGVTITSSDPLHFFIQGMDMTTGVYTVCGEQNQAFGPYINGGAAVDSMHKVYFTSTSAGTFPATITVKNGTTVIKTFYVSGTCNRRVPVFEWTDQREISTQTNDVIVDPVHISGYNGVISLVSNDPSIIRIDYGNTLVPVSEGTTDITASIPQNDMFYAGSSTATFTATDLKTQEIVWTQSLIKVAASPYPTVTPDGVAQDRKSGAATGLGITYSSDNPNVVDFLNGQLVFKNPGTANITATAAGNSSYHSTTYTRKARVLTSDACNSIITTRSRIDSPLDIDLGGITPSRLSFTGHFTNTHTADITIYGILKNGSAIFVHDTTRYSVTNKSYYFDRSLNRNVVKLRFTGDFASDNYYITDLNVYRATFIEPTLTTSFNFGEVPIGGEHIVTLSGANYANLRSPIAMSLSGTDASRFIVVTETYGSGCGEEGTAEVTVKYRPDEARTVSNPHTATLNLIGVLNDGTTDTVKITLTGIGGKQTQTITWNQTLENLNSLTTKHYNTTHDHKILMTATTDAHDEYGAMLPITYTSLDPTIANVVNGYLEIYKAGTVDIIASQPGNEEYKEAHNPITKTLVISRMPANLSVTYNATPVVFTTNPVSAESSGDDGTYTRASDGVVSFSIESKCGSVPTASILNYDAANKTCSLKVDTRCSESGTTTVLKVKLAMTDVFDSVVLYKNIDASKTNLNFMWDDDLLDGDLFYGQSYTPNNVFDYNAELIAAGTPPTITYSSSQTGIVAFNDSNASTFSVVKAGVVTLYARYTATVNSYPSLSPAEKEIKTDIGKTFPISGSTSVGHSSLNNVIMTLSDYIFDVGSNPQVSSSNSDEFHARVTGGILYIDFYPTASGLRSTTITITCNGEEYHCTVQGTATNDAVDFGTVETQRFSAPETFTISYTPSAGSPVVIYGDGDAQHFQYKTSSTNWTTISTSSASGLTITDAGTTTYQVRFTPTDATGGADKTSTLHITQGSHSYIINIKGTPAPATVELKTTQSFEDIPTTEASVAIDLSEFTIMLDNPSTSLAPSAYNTDDVRSTITFVSNNESVVQIGAGNVVNIIGPGSTTITATLPATDNYKTATCIIYVSIDDVAMSLEISDIVVPADVNSASYNVIDFVDTLASGWTVDCNYDDAVFTVEDVTTAIAKVESNTFTGYKVGTLTIKVTASCSRTPTTDSDIYTIDIPRGSFIFEKPGNWDTNDNWHRDDILPDTNHHVIINAACTIPSSMSQLAECYDLSFDNSTYTPSPAGSLLIDAEGKLSVEGTLYNTNAAKLKITSTEQHQGTLLFNAGSPAATIEIYLKGTTHPSYTGKQNPDWQYRGFIGTNASLSNWTVMIAKWDEALNATNCWGTQPVYNQNGTYNGVAWDGYGMANYGGLNHQYSYTTTLIPTSQSHTYTLSRTISDQENCGVSLLTNSYTAPIDMSSDYVQFGAGVEQTFWFYLTRSHLDWEYNKEGAFETYPMESGMAISSVTDYEYLAAGQSFLIKTKINGGTLTINKEAFGRRANGEMRAPAKREDFNVLRITLLEDTLGDDLYLLENDNCTNGFDNGYDGSKISSSSRPNLYATNSFGRTAVNSDVCMLGQKIGYKSVVDGARCTISFNTEKLQGYGSLYLYDRETGRYTDILAGETYTFEGRAAGEPERFEIVGSKDDGSKFVASSDRKIEVIGRQALLSGFDAESGEMVIVTDMKGNIICSFKASQGPLIDLPEMPVGTYIIYCGKTHNKFIWK